MIIRKHIPPSKLTHFLNESYNKLWIWKHGIKHCDAVAVSQFKTSSRNIASAEPYIISWLKNLDRSVLLLEESSDVKDFHFVDIGCGTGVLCLYAAYKHPFKSFTGIDFEKNLIHKAKENYAVFPKSQSIDFIEGDAGLLDLTAKRYFLFLFNPFGADVLKSFLERNLKLLADTKSVMAYTNDRHLELFNQYDCKILRNDKYNLSIIKF